MINVVEAISVNALQKYQSGDRVAAESLCWDALRHDPLHAQSIYLLGVLAIEQGSVSKAIIHLHHLTLLQPGQVTFHHALGEAYRSAGRNADAVACFQTALTLEPNFSRAYHSLGVAQMDLNDVDQAVNSFRRSLELNPQDARAQNNLGQALHKRNETDRAAACFAESIRIAPHYAIAHNNLGAVVQTQGQLEFAEKCFREAIRLVPNYPEAHFNLGSLLSSQGDMPRAAQFFREAIRLRPDYPRAHHGLGRVLESLCEFPAALECYHAAVKLKPDFAEAYQSLGSLLLLKPDWERAREAFEKVLELQPDNNEAFARLCFTRQILCDWRTAEADIVRLWADADRAINAHQPTPVLPFSSLTLPWTAEQQLAVASSHSDAARDQASREPPRAEIQIKSVARDERLRIGYLSGEFRDHAVSHLIQSVFGCHDRQRFEVFAYSFGADDGSSYRKKIMTDCDHFRDLRSASLAECDRTLGEDQLHLLVDLQGHIGYPRLSLLARRLAPIQAHYMGFPGPIGADFIDYVIGDPIVTPAEMQHAYREKLVILPHCYIPTDNCQTVAAMAGSRADHGLPERAPVFCAFNNTYKIEPTRFTVWMRILKQVPGSVLWLSPMAPSIDHNLRREAESRGVDGDRLILARRMAGKAEHLARHQLADLYLDTLHYNGHTTAVDALWAGLPVLTCPGGTFASRVASSLLTNVGLTELIASDEADYERKAVRLVTAPHELEQLRMKLAANRTTWPLFDTARLTRNLESAYRAMWDAHVAGKCPEMIFVKET